MGDIKVIPTTESSPYAGAAKKETTPSSINQFEMPVSNTAIVLAKTQASASRERARNLFLELKKMKQQLTRERNVTKNLTTKLKATQKKCLELDKALAIRAAAAHDLQQRLAQEQAERLSLAEKNQNLELEKRELQTYLGSRQLRRIARRRKR